MACPSLCPQSLIGARHWFGWMNGKNYGELRMIGLVPKSPKLFYVAFVDRGDVRRIISLRRANQREASHYVHNT
jgi:uncharacterized protein